MITEHRGKHSQLCLLEVEDTWEVLPTMSAGYWGKVAAQTALFEGPEGKVNSTVSYVCWKWGTRGKHCLPCLWSVGENSSLAWQCLQKWVTGGSSVSQVCKLCGGDESRVSYRFVVRGTRHWRRCQPFLGDKMDRWQYCQPYFCVQSREEGGGAGHSGTRNGQILILGAQYSASADKNSAHYAHIGQVLFTATRNMWQKDGEMSHKRSKLFALPLHINDIIQWLFTKTVKTGWEQMLIWHSCFY